MPSNLHRSTLKRNKLPIGYDYDFEIIGIIAAIKEFKLAWSIGKELNIEMLKQKDIQINLLNSTIWISNYIYETENSVLRMLNNKCVNDSSQKFLIPEMNRFDYLIKLEGEGDTFTPDEVAEKMKQIDSVQYSAVIDYTKLKSKENFLF